MRIGVVHWAFPPTIGGVETHIITLYPPMAKKGHEIFLLTEDLKGRGRKESYMGIEVTRSKVMNLSRVKKSLGKDIRPEIEKEMGRWLDEVRPDIVHAHNLLLYVTDHAEVLGRLCKERGIKTVLTAHNVLFKGKSGYEPVFRHVLGKVGWDKIIAVSKFVGRHLVMAGAPRRKVVTVYHGLDTSLYRKRTVKELEPLYKRYPRLKGRKIVLQPARIRETKGCRYSVEAIRLIKREFPEALLIMTGKGRKVSFMYTDEFQAMLEKYIKDNGLEENVFMNDFTSEEVRLLYSAADVVIYPSASDEKRDDEAFGLATIEAGSSEKPIVVSRSGGMPEVVKNGVNGFVVPKRNAKMLAERCIEILKDPDLGKRLGKKGRETVEKGFTIDRMVDNTIRVFDGVLS
jgi:glycosyltransferase involved in cell wall biosynthesis